MALRHGAVNQLFGKIAVGIDRGGFAAAEERAKYGARHPGQDEQNEQREEDGYEQPAAAVQEVLCALRQLVDPRLKDIRRLQIHHGTRVGGNRYNNGPRNNPTDQVPNA